MEKKINETIADVESGKIGLVNDWEFYEKEYTDGAEIVYLVQRVEGREEIECIFEEKSFILEMRDAVYSEEKTQDELDELFNELNGLDDRYDFGKVVAYRIDGGNIVWL